MSPKEDELINPEDSEQYTRYGDFFQAKIALGWDIQKITEEWLKIEKKLRINQAYDNLKVVHSPGKKSRTGPSTPITGTKDTDYGNH